MKILERFCFCLSGPVLEAHPVPGLDLAQGLTPDRAPGLERAPLPGRGPTHPPPHLIGDRSAVAPGPHLEGGNGGALDHVRPKGAATTLLDPPILAPVQKRNNFIMAFKPRKGILVEVHVVLQKKQPPDSFSNNFLSLTSVRKHSGNMTSLCRIPHSPFLKHTYFPICDKCL